ncbi:TIGR00282 family metallophosphoesterase [Candidatus Peregrinibacteria bacterium]|nr:TIGR00282 family metallophosphoesterase [Candidatus Peregrinibacteria bacterium]
MKILFIGDIYGRPGREIVRKILPEVLSEHRPDLVLANAENLTHGNGFSAKHIEEMIGLGIDAFTTGNHVWDNKDGVSYLGDPAFPVLRPANFAGENLPGRGYGLFEGKNGGRILVINLQGGIFMKMAVKSPFLVADAILQQFDGEDIAGIFVDFHAETTSEKYALGCYLDGRVSAFVGTHTHVATCDLRILDKGTAFMSDVGMTGPYDSVIGVQKELVIKKFLTGEKVPFHPETEGKMIFNSVLIELDPKNKKALNVTHVTKFYG